MPQIIVPFLNPINFVEVEPEQVPQYVSKFMDDYLHNLRLDPYQIGVRPFYQPWQYNDVITLQFQNNAGQVTIQIVNCKGQVFLSFIMTQKQQNKYMPDYFIYESNSALTPLPDGVYIMLAKTTSGKELVSEPFEVKREQMGTLLIEYTNRKYYGKMVFETGIKPSLRVPGKIKLGDLSSVDTMYEDQELDNVMIESRPYRVFILTLIQIPDWMAVIINWIMGCSDIRIDGEYYAKDTDAKFDNLTDSFFGARVDYRIQLREGSRKSAKVFNADVSTTDQIVMTVNADSKGFADTSENASSSVVTFINID